MSRAATEPSNGFLVAPIRECSTRERSSLSEASALSTCATAKYRAASISTIRVQSCARSGCCQLLQPTPSDAESMGAARSKLEKKSHETLNQKENRSAR